MFLTLLSLLALGAIVNGPLFSLDASGQLGKALVYSKWKGRSYVREYAIPANPNSLAQRWRRAMFGFLSQAWATLGATEKASWEPEAGSKSISPFNEFVSYNMDSQSVGDAPLDEWLATPVTPTGTLTSVVGTGGLRKITYTTVEDDSLISGEHIVYGLSESSTGDASSIARSVALIANDAEGMLAGEIVGLEAGTYYLAAAVINLQGGISPWVVESDPIVVTG